MNRFKSAIYVLPKVDFFSQGGRGRVTHAIGLGNGLAENGLRVTMISGPGLDRFRHRLDGAIEIIEVGARNQGARVFPQITWQLKLFSRLKANLEDRDGELILTRYAVGNLLLQLLMTRASLRNHILVLEVNSLAFHQYAAVPQLIRGLILKIELGILNRFDVIYVVSEKLRDDLLAGGLTIPAVVIPNAADAVQLEMLHENEIEGPTRFVYSGQFHDYYDFDSLISAFLKLRQKRPDTTLHFWGGGKLSRMIAEYADQNDSIQLHGRFEEHDLQGLFNSSTDIFVLPSKPGGVAEITSPIKLFEYISFGVPVLAAQVGQVAEILEHGKTAYLYNPRDLNSLVSLMVRVVDSRIERKSVGEHARKEQLDHHTWQKRAATLLGEIDSRLETAKSTVGPEDRRQ